MRIGILGGTFNPIHIAHMEMAASAMKAYDLDKLVFMPSGLPAHKSNIELIASEYRMEMVRLSIKGIPGYEVSDFEVKRQGYTYTYETLSLLKQKYPEDEFFFIIGGDSVDKFFTWKKPEMICKLAHIAATKRPGVDPDVYEKTLKKMREVGGPGATLFEMKIIDVSSSEIRSRLFKGDFESLKGLLNEDVIEYIKKNRLYSEISS